jgi:hypothetical protein
MHTLTPLKNVIFAIQYFSIFEHLIMNGRILRLQMEEQPPIWRVVANILIEQSQTADKGWSTSYGVGQGANNSSP